MEIEGEMWFVVVLLAILIGFLGAAILGTIYEDKIILSKETANKICFELTGEAGVIALDYDEDKNLDLIERGELYCQLPSYDKTHLIKVGK